MAQSFKTVNPYTNTTLKTYEYHSEEETEAILNQADTCFKNWQSTGLDYRVNLIKQLRIGLLEHKNEFAALMTAEMGKPIAQGVAEIEKCALLCNYYAEQAPDFLKDKIINTEAKKSYVSYAPLGTILAIMPWNYPFWQVVRFAIPTLLSGNTAILKHAENTTQCGLAFSELLIKVGFPKNAFQVLIANHQTTEQVIKDQRIKAVSLTGSERAGKSVAKAAGDSLKKCVLELGGNNACIILNDADLDKHLDSIVAARYQNNGQSCIAAKRFIIEDKIYNEFLERFTNKVKALQIGCPTKNDTTISTLARPDLAQDLKQLVDNSITLGAKLHLGNTTNGSVYSPTILTNITCDMPVFTEETFGPVASITKVNSAKEAFKLAKNSKYGLGVMVFTKNVNAVLPYIKTNPDGAFFINSMVKSDPRLPFGGTKLSGYGRELAKEGLMEFVNVKTVYIA